MARQKNINLIEALAAKANALGEKSANDAQSAADYREAAIQLEASSRVASEQEAAVDKALNILNDAGVTI
jgi:hypothetical protein